MLPQLQETASFCFIRSVSQSGHHQLHKALSYGRRLVWAEPLREHNQQTYLRLLGRLGRRAEALAHYNHLYQLLQAELDIMPLPETRAIAADLRREADAPLTGSESLPFTGRAAERTALIEQLERLLGGQGGVWAVEGQPGVGKSRLLRELAASARWRNITVLSAPYSNRPTGSPIAPLQAAFAAVVTGPRRAQLEMTLPDETLAACAPLVPAWQTRAALPDLPPIHQRYRFQHALGALLGELTRLTPLLFLLDDWHWADPLAWEYLDALVQCAPTYRCLLILAWRRAEIEERSEWLKVQAWEREGRLTVLALSPWTFTEMMAALPVPHHVAASRLWAISSGNPFLLTQALHALGEGRVPETDVVARAETLPPEARLVLVCAAVFGRTIPLAVWAAATDLPPDTLTALGDVLTQHYFLHMVESGYAFAHDLVQAALYEAVPPETQRHWHGRCASVLAALAPDQYRARAFHLDRAGLNESAAVLYRQASEQELRLGAYVEAQAALNRALELWPETPSPARAEMLLAAARLHFITDESKAQAVIAEAARIAEALGDGSLQAHAALLAAELALKTGQNMEARASLTQALTYAQTTSDRVQQAEAHYQLGELALREGQMREAHEHYDRALGLAQQIGDRALEAASLEGLGFALRNSGGDSEEALRYLRQALALRRTLDDHFGEAVSLMNLLSVLQTTGALDETLALGEEALAANERIGYARGAAIVRGSLAQVQCVLGHFTEARQLITGSIDYFAGVNDPTAVGLYTDLLGLITERSGQPAEAEVFMRTAVEQLLANGAEFFTALAQMDLGTLYIRAGRAVEALPLLEQAQAVFAANNTPMELHRTTALLGLAYVRLGQGERGELTAVQSWETFQSMPPEGEERQYNLWALWQLLLAVGRDKEASTVLLGAYTTLQAQAACLSDPALRQSFFEQVPVNREIVAAYDQWQHITRHTLARLVRLSTPLGRPLTEADYVEIRWTVNAPEDEAISDTAERRRFVLHRLLSEAAAQGAAPTDDDLARALGVSRRTILRDMQVLEQAGAKRTTRKRKKQASEG